MTEPTGFQYRDDSVVARISVDVPASTLTDLDQVRERASMLRTELEAISRAGGDWLASLQQVPAITEQANQAYRNMITQLERMSYIQQELGGHANIGMQGSPMGGQPGAGVQPYSTAAPAGYVDPFMGMPGTGMGMGMQGAQTYMQSMMMNDPRMFANMAAQRGYPVNPAQMGLVGGAVAAQQGAAPHTGGGMGQGADAPGAMTSQPTQASRNSASAPNPNEGGAPSNSEHQREPATPHPDTPAWQQTLNTVASTAGSVLNETKAGMGGRGGGLLAGGAAALGAIGRIGGNAGGGGGDGGGGGGGGILGGLGGGNWGRVAAGAGLAAGAAGLGVKGFNMVQNAGEQIQSYANLGAESGGGAAAGAGYEMQARMMAMNPFITLDQSRSVMQSALKNGYTGKEFDTVVGFMAENLKEMNMSSTESMQLFQDSVVKGKLSVQDLSKEMGSLKDLTSTPGNQMSQSERNKAYEDVNAVGAGLGLQGKALTNTTAAITEAFSDNQQLKNIVPQTAQSALQNPNFLMMMQNTNGVRGVASPEMVIPRMQEQGIDPGQAYWKTLQRIAQQAQAGTGGDDTLGGSRFYNICQSMGINLGSPDDAYELYSQLIHGQDPTKKAYDRKAAAEAGAGRPESEKFGNAVLAPIQGVGDLFAAGFQAFTGNGMGAKESLTAAGRQFGRTGEQYASDFGLKDVMTADERVAAGSQRTNPNNSPNVPQNPVGPSTINGQVQGQLTITVDQAGRVSAPQSVQISGSQRAVNAGQGSGTMNNPGPGDPAYQHSMPSMGGGG